MTKLLIGSALLSSLLFAGGHVTPMTEMPATEEPMVEETSAWNFELSPYLAMSSISGDSAVISGESS
jgi:hypothetical protein